MMRDSVRSLVELVRQVVPGVECDVDAAPPESSGTSLVFFSLDGHDVVLRWDPESDYPWQITSSEDPGYGEKFDELYKEAWRAVARVAYLLAFKQRTSPRPTSLQSIRDVLGVSQTELAHRLGVKQSAVSKLERRDNPGLDAVWRYVVALGGEPELRARFGGREFVVIPVMLAKEAEQMITVATASGAATEERLRAVDFLRRTLPGLKELGHALRMPDLETRAKDAIARAENRLTR